MIYNYLDHIFSFLIGLLLVSFLFLYIYKKPYCIVIQDNN